MKEVRKMNLPNKLTVMRIALVPFFMFFLIFSNILGETPSRIIALVIFAVASITDMLDGKIARKYNLITDFGKFLDPLADKMLVLGAFTALLFNITAAEGRTPFTYVFVCAVFIVIFRELAVTSLRLVASGKEGVVIAANMPGKIKTVSQMICVICVILDPVIFGGLNHIISYITVIFMAVMTLYSGINYFMAYKGVINTDK